jgi:hypothetical protein
MTMNNRPVDSPKLQKAMDEVKAVFARYGYAGCAMVISAEEAVFCYAMHAPWSAIRFDPDTPLGWRIRTSLAEDGGEGRHARLEGAAHTICQLSDFGAQTMDWMEQIKAMLRDTGLEIEHTPFGGKPLPSLGSGP